jgi:hypothetical protein
MPIKILAMKDLFKGGYTIHDRNQEVKPRHRFIRPMEMPLKMSKPITMCESNGLYLNN